MSSGTPWCSALLARTRNIAASITSPISRMKSERALLVRNQQRDRKIDSAFLRKAVTTLLEEVMKIREYEVGVHLVTRPRIKELNETYLRHEGSTDVITFDYLDLARPD